MNTAAIIVEKEASSIIMSCRVTSQELNYSCYSCSSMSLPDPQYPKFFLNLVAVVGSVGSSAIGMEVP